MQDAEFSLVPGETGIGAYVQGTYMQGEALDEWSTVTYQYTFPVQVDGM